MSGTGPAELGPYGKLGLNMSSCIENMYQHSDIPPPFIRCVNFALFSVQRLTCGYITYVYLTTTQMNGSTENSHWLKKGLLMISPHIENWCHLR